MALEFKVVLDRLNNARSIEDDALASLEYLDIQRMFEEDKENEQALYEKINNLNDDLENLRSENQRLRDINAEIRLQSGSSVSNVVQEVKEKVEDIEDVIDDLTFSDLAEIY